MKAIEEIGAATTGFLEDAGGIALLTAEVAGFIARFRVRFDETLLQAFRLGVQSAPIVLLTSLFIGMVVSYESAQNAVNYGVSNLVGGAVAYASARELGPMLSSVVVAGRAGAAIAAEFGSMVVTEQIEALLALGLSPTRMLVVPRVVALVTMMPLLTICADIVAILGGAFLAHSLAGIPYGTFMQSAREYATFGDFMRGLVKAGVFGAIIAIVGSYEGMRTRGGAAGVGIATTNAVVNAIILIFIFNFALSLVLFGSAR